MADYLLRIGVACTELHPNIETLRRLQRAHLTAVPFENLDIHWKRPIALDEEKFFEKIVSSRRGGFCYELNGLFNVLLRSIGFETRLISARVFNGKEFGPEFDHAAMIVTIGGVEYLADVGFGSFSAEPLQFVLDVEQSDPAGIFVIRKYDSEYFKVAKQNNGLWVSEYIFQDIARELFEFEEICDFQQYSPDSHFKKGKLCSIMTETGRKTLSEKSFITTENGQRNEIAVDSDSGFYNILEREFHIAPERA
ncbi:MAG: arylamine N-acetyltransferase [Pyrinomonadaceae bacterium]